MEFLAYIVILLLVFLESSIVQCMHKSRIPQRPQEIIFDVTKFGAVGNGKTDDSKAFQSAWNAACNKGLSVTISVPNGKIFMVSRVVFQGPCKSNSITFQILGKMIAPPRSAWKSIPVDEWIYFHGVDGLNVIGNRQGTIDGQGLTWWTQGANVGRPAAMRFSYCNKLQVKGLKHVNSQRNHISINGCNNVLITNLEIIAPKTSPNTDGIDVSSSTNVQIHDCTMETGDDCIAINGGTSNINISGIACGPGHGISIGSLGKDGKHDEVQGVYVSNCNFTSTENGVRIKTWQGGSGFARNITFSNIRFNAADNPIIIDQFYCPHQTCDNKTSAVKVSDVKYIGLHGTSSGNNATINFSCSQTNPCTNIIMDNVDIKPLNPTNGILTKCINAYGTAHESNLPAKCLQTRHR